MKIIGLILIFIGCTGVGYILDMKHRMRLKEIAALIYSFEQLKGEIDYRLTPLPEACMHVARTSRLGVGHIFENFGKALEARSNVDTCKMWEEAIDKEKHRYHLMKEDYDILYEFGQLSGYLDKAMQKSQIEFVLIKLKDLAIKGELNKEKTSKLYTGMGLLIGACLCILLI